MSANKEYRILLIEDNFEYADHLRSLIDSQPSHTFHYDRVSLFSEALKTLRVNQFDSVLLNFDLKDLKSLETISELHLEAPELPIIGLINDTDEGRANEAIEFGLHDRIIKNGYDENIIVSKILFAIRRMETISNSNKQQALSSELIYDSRTGLPNQILFSDRLEQAISRAEPCEGTVSLVAIHLDNFTLIQQQHGLKVANEILKKTTKLLNSSAQKCDSIAHLDDDKFMIILESFDKASSAVACAEKVVRAFSRSMRIDGSKFKITTSIGLASYPDCNTIHELVKCAEQSMSRAQGAGGNRYKIYTENIAEEAIWKYGLENDLEKALKHQEFELHYQPLYDLEQRCVTSFEALLRWNHPEKGRMMPGAFIDELEASEHILEVGEWVMNEACNRLKTWQSKYPSLSIGINLSARQLQDPYLLERVNSTLQTHEIDPESIEFEITERQLVDKDDAITQYNIQKLVDRGITLALDDFGTGYSTESYFQQFPKNTINTIKIDRFDIGKMMTDKSVAEKIEQYIEFSHQHDMCIIAEGIEEEAQLERLQELDVDVVQGYLLSKPISATKIEDGLRRNDFVFDSIKPVQTLELVGY